MTIPDQPPDPQGSVAAAPRPAPRTAREPSGVTTLAYVGCRTTAERHGEGSGLSVFRVEEATGALELVQHLEGLVNPSYLAWGPGRRNLYAVHGDHAEVSTFSADSSTGRLEFMATVPSGGTNPVHLAALDDQTLAVANYASGTVSLLDIRTDGSLGRTPRQVIELADYVGGRTSHPHQILPDPCSSTVVVPDKGADTVFLLDYARGMLHVAEAVPASPGAGPRHAAFHPAQPRLYVVNELASSVSTYEFSRVPRPGGTAALRSLTVLQELPTVPSSAEGNTASGIVATRDFRSVYVSNRGHNSVAHFHVDRRTGLLSLEGWDPTGGDCPRFLTFDPAGSRVYVANERTSSIVPFAVDPHTGDLRREPSTTRTGSPVCVVFSNTTSHS